jgi:hypothetical protein
MLSLGRKKERKKEDGQLKLISALPLPPQLLNFSCHLIGLLVFNSLILLEDSTSCNPRVHIG